MATRAVRMDDPIGRLTDAAGALDAICQILACGHARDLHLVRPADLDCLLTLIRHEVLDAAAALDTRPA